MELGKDLVAASATPLVLAILMEGDSYGYAIIKRVATLSGGHLHWTDGMLYPVLHRLERQGLVVNQVGHVGQRAQAQVLPHHQGWPVAARRTATAVAGGGRHPARHLDEGVQGMTTSAEHALLEEQIAHWREYLRRRRAIDARDVAELEDHLRDQMGELTGAGLAGDEAFLIAVKRLGQPRCAVARVRARAFRTAVEAAGDAAGRRARHAHAAKSLVVLLLAIVSAAAIKLPALFGFDFDRDEGFYARNFSLFVLPVLTGYFAWKRKLDAVTWVWLALAFAAAGLFANVFPFARAGDTQVLTALHLPIAAWLIVGVAYVGGRWFASGARMNFVRFSGELFIYYVLIALGGGVLTAFTADDVLGHRHRVPSGWRSNGWSPAERWPRSSSDRGWWKPSKASSRTWPRC